MHLTHSWRHRLKHTWEISEAKNRLAELIELAFTEGAQTITRDGRKVVVVLSFDEYERLAKRPLSLSKFLLNSPLAGSELSIDRDRGLNRDNVVGE